MSLCLSVSGCLFSPSLSASLCLSLSVSVFMCRSALMSFISVLVFKKKRKLVLIFCVPPFRKVVHLLVHPAFTDELYNVTVFNFPTTCGATFHLQGLTRCVLYFHVLLQWYGCWCLALLTCAQTLMFALCTQTL